VKKTLSLYLPVLLIGSALIFAVFTYGAVDIWAQTIAGILAFAGGLAALIIYRRSAGRKMMPWTAVVTLFVLLIWTSLQSQMLRAPGKACTDNLPHLVTALFLWSAFLISAGVAFRAGQDRRLTRFTVFLVVILGAVEAAIGIMALYGDLGIYSRLLGARRAIGTFSSGNSFGGFLALSLTLSLGAIFASTGRVMRHIRRRGKGLFHTASSQDYRLFSFILLVVAALAAFLVKTGRRDGLRYLHFGWIGALVAGLMGIHSLRGS